MFMMQLLFMKVQCDRTRLHLFPRSVTVTLLLTIVAFKFVIASYVPPTSYLTFLDKYVGIAILMIGAEILENFVISYFVDYPDAYYWDASFAIALSGLWTFAHVLIVIGTHRKWFWLSWDIIESRDKADDHEVEVEQESTKVTFIDEGADGFTLDEDSATAVHWASSKLEKAMVRRRSTRQQL
jgi:hypothetical protein